MIEIGPAPDTLTPEQLVQVLREPVEKLVKEELAQDVEPERYWQYRKMRLHDLYYQGRQNVAPTMFEGGYADFTPAGNPVSRIDGEDEGYSDANLNIIRGYGRKLVAVIGQRAPNTKAEPDDPEDEKSRQSAIQADIGADVLDAQWDTDQRNMELAYSLYKAGTSFLFTDWVTDGLKYGITQEPQINTQSVNVGGQMVQVPQVGGMQQYENGAVEIAITNLYTTTCPHFARSIDEVPWLIYEFEMYKGRLLRMFSELRDILPDIDGSPDDSTSSGIGAMVRSAAQSPVSMPTPKRPNMWNYKRAWLTPDVYEHVKDPGMRQLLKQYFSDGVKATLVQNKLIRLERQKLTDYWVECKPECSEYLFADAICTDLIPVQDMKNDIGINIPVEAFTQGLPVTFMEKDLVNERELNEQRSLPARFIGVKPGYGKSIADSFYQSQPAQFSAQALPWMQSVESDGRAIIGVQPEIYGGEAVAPTAHQAELNKNAALMQLGMTWLFMRKAWAKAKRNGVRLMARYGVGQVKSPSQSAMGAAQTRVLDLAELSETGWHFDAEEAIPKTWGEKRDAVMFMIEKGTEIAGSLNLLHPINVPYIHDLIGLPELFDPIKDQRDKTFEIIGELLKQKPIQAPQPDGSVQIQPSIPADPEDNHQIVAMVCAAWFVDRSGRAQKKSNPEGYANVIAWWQQHEKMAVPPPAPPPPPKMSIQEASKDMPPEVQAALFEDYKLPNAAAAMTNLAAQQKALQAAIPPLGAPQPAGAGGPAGPPSPAGPAPTEIGAGSPAGAGTPSPILQPPDAIKQQQSLQ